jgi:hypothetical protein
MQQIDGATERSAVLLRSDLAAVATEFMKNPDHDLLKFF